MLLVTDVYFSWLYGYRITELLLDGVMLMLIQWLLKQFKLGYEID